MWTTWMRSRMASEQPVPFVDQTVVLSVEEYKERCKRTTEQQLRRLYNSPEYAERYGGNAARTVKWVVTTVLVLLLAGSALHFTYGGSFRAHRMLPSHTGQVPSLMSQASQTTVGEEQPLRNLATEIIKPKLPEPPDRQELAEPSPSTDLSDRLPSKNGGTLHLTSPPSSSGQSIKPAAATEATNQYTSSGQRIISATATETRSENPQQPNQKLATPSLSSNQLSWLPSQSSAALSSTSKLTSSKRPIIPATATEARNQTPDSSEVTPSKQPGAAQTVMQVSGGSSLWTTRAACSGTAIILLLLGLLAKARRQKQCSVRMQQLAEKEAEASRAALQLTRDEMRCKSQAASHLQRSLERAKAAVVEARARYLEIDSQRSELEIQGWNLRCEVYDTQQALERARMDAVCLKEEFEQHQTAQEAQVDQQAEEIAALKLSLDAAGSSAADSHDQFEHAKHRLKAQAEEEAQALQAALQQTRLDLHEKAQSNQLLLQTLQHQEAAIAAATNQNSALEATKTVLQNQVQRQTEAIAAMTQALEDAASDLARSSELHRQDKAQAEAEAQALKADLQQTRLDLDEKARSNQLLLQMMQDQEAALAASSTQNSALENAKTSLENQMEHLTDAIAAMGPAPEDPLADAARNSEHHRQDRDQTAALEVKLRETRQELDEKIFFVADLLQSLEDSEAGKTAAIQRASELEAAKSELAEVVKGQLGMLARLRESLRQAESDAVKRVQVSGYENSLPTQASSITALSPQAQCPPLQLPISPASTSRRSPRTRENRDPLSPPKPCDRRQPGFKTLQMTDNAPAAASAQAGNGRFLEKPEKTDALFEQPGAARGEDAAARSNKTPFFKRREVVSDRPIEHELRHFAANDRPAASKLTARTAALSASLAEDTAQDRTAAANREGAATTSSLAAAVRKDGGEPLIQTQRRARAVTSDEAGNGTADDTADAEGGNGKTNKELTGSSMQHAQENAGPEGASMPAKNLAAAQTQPEEEKNTAAPPPQPKPSAEHSLKTTPSAPPLPPSTPPAPASLRAPPPPPAAAGPKRPPPPPPAPPGSKRVPPPPPPPAPRGSNRLPAPPPPALPGQKRPPPPLPGKKLLGASSAKVLPGPMPSVKLKGFFWEKIPDIRIAGTFWSSHPPKYELLEKEQVEALFQAKQPAVATTSKRIQKPKKINLLDVQRAMAIGVQARSLNCHWTGVRAAIANFDPLVFRTGDDVVAVLQSLPSEEEQGLLRTYLESGGRLEALTDEEQFAADLMKVPRASSRLTTFKIKFEAQSQLEEAASALESHIMAQSELRSSQCFAAVLEECLALGNFFNHGNARMGQAAGFRLQSLTKLQDTRSTDGKTNLMAYLAEKLVLSTPPQQPLLSELPHAGNLHTTLAETKDMIEKMAQSLNVIKTELEVLPPPLSVRLEVAEEGGVKLSVSIDGYQLQMAELAERFQEGLARVQTQQDRAEKGFAALTVFYGENPQSLPAEANFWRPIASFVQSFTAAQNTILAAQKEKAVRAEKARVAKARREGVSKF